uniref:Ig-like domain-containing protein n=1 Tax=Phasianus colchicus TaxID=9054 RepID=A0A669PMQ1_PHACC
MFHPWKHARSGWMGSWQPDLRMAALLTAHLLVLQFPEDASVLLNSTVWMLCVFEYPKEENEEPVVYWRKGPSCDNQQSLRSSSGAGRPHIHITKDIFRGFSILKLSNVDKNDSNLYFCDVILTQKTHGKCGNGTKLTVHDFTCKDCVRSEPTWWCWFLLLGYALFVTTVIISFGVSNNFRNKYYRPKDGWHLLMERYYK